MVIYLPSQSVDSEPILDELTPRVLAGTVAGIYPTFVNDGRAIVYSDGAQFYRVALDGTAATPASVTQAGAGNGSDALPGTGFIVGAFSWSFEPAA